MRGRTCKHLIDRFVSDRVSVALYGSGGVLCTAKFAWDTGLTEYRNFRDHRAARRFIEGIINGNSNQIDAAPVRQEATAGVRSEASGYRKNTSGAKGRLPHADAKIQ